MTKAKIIFLLLPACLLKLLSTSADDIKTAEGETILKADGKDGSHKIMYYPDGMVTVYKMNLLAIHNFQSITMVIWYMTLTSAITLNL